MCGNGGIWYWYSICGVQSANEASAIVVGLGEFLLEENVEARWEKSSGKFLATESLSERKADRTRLRLLDADFDSNWDMIMSPYRWAVQDILLAKLYDLLFNVSDYLAD
jgi:hypothetical protein